MQRWPAHAVKCCCKRRGRPIAIIAVSIWPGMTPYAEPFAESFTANRPFPLTIPISAGRFLSLLAGKAGYQLFQYDPAHPCPPAGMAVPGAEKSLPPTSGTTPDSNLLSGAFFYPVFP